MAVASNALRDKYAIVGVGQSPLGKVPGTSALGLLALAMKNAVEDAGLRKEDVDAVISRGPEDVYTHHQHVGEVLGIDARFSTSVGNGGASQVLSVILAVMAIEAGLCDVAVCGYSLDGWSRTHRSTENRMAVQLVPAGQQPTEFLREFGLFGAAAVHALGARRHMALYGTTKEQMGAVAITFRDHARLNPCAQMRQPLDMQQYLSGRLVVDPFNVYDCSLLTDGAAAVVVTTAERARHLRRTPVLISGFATFNNLRGWFFDEHMVETAALRSSRAAYAMAGIGPDDVDTAELYDCFTYMVLTQLEDYGFCAKGEGGPFAASGALRLGGRLPTNTSGGQLSEGHVEGMLKITEAVRQLRHEYPPERQVRGAEVAVVSGHGGNTVCHGTLVLKRGS